MQTIDNDPARQLPSARTLLRSTLIAAAAAAVLLVTAVMPAEYGVDPTGVGRLLGLTQMGEIKMALAEEAAAAEAAEAAALAGGSPGAGLAADTLATAATPATDSAAAAPRSDVTTVTLRPGEGTEVKLEMRQGSAARYSWSVDGGVVNYDTHGDPYDAPREFYHGYGKGTATSSDEGVLVAAFDGTHGWFWRNRTRDVVTVTLRTEGEYLDVRRLN